MNQVKSNLAKAPANEARLVTRMSSPVHWVAKTSVDSMVGPAEAPGAADFAKS